MGWQSRIANTGGFNEQDRESLRVRWPHSAQAASRSRGCSQDDLKSTGGNGLLYCFATN